MSNAIARPTPNGRIKMIEIEFKRLMFDVRDA